MRRLGDVWLILALFGRRGVLKSSVRRPLCQEYFSGGQSKLAAFRQRLGSARRVRASVDTIDTIILALFAPRTEEFATYGGAVRGWFCYQFLLLFSTDGVILVRAP
jgi:hypothetical protein